MTNTERVLQALSNGKNQTVADLRRVTKVANVTAAISTLREQGYCIYTNKRANGQYYRLGTPSKAMISLVQEVFPSLFQR